MWVVQVPSKQEYLEFESRIVTRNSPFVIFANVVIFTGAIILAAFL